MSSEDSRMAREVKDVVNIEVAYQITDQSLEAKQNGKESALANMISRQPEKYTECTLDWNPGADFLYVNDKRFFWRFKRVRIEVMRYNGQRTEALGMGTMVEFRSFRYAPYSSRRCMWLQNGTLPSQNAKGNASISQNTYSRCYDIFTE